MSIDNTVNDLLLGAGVPSAKFPAIGTTVRGTIEAAEVSEQRDMDGNVRTWDDGNPRKQIVITLATEDRDPAIEDDDGHRKLYVKGQMTQAVREALKKAGAKSLEVGGTLAVRYESDGVPARAGLNPPKQYIAKYEAPKAPAVGVDDLL